MDVMGKVSFGIFVGGLAILSPAKNVEARELDLWKRFARSALDLERSINLKGAINMKMLIYLIFCVVIFDQVEVRTLTEIEKPTSDLCAEQSEIKIQQGAIKAQKKAKPSKKLGKMMRILTMRQRQHDTMNI